MKFALLPLLFCAAFAARNSAAESPAPEPQPKWPLWDGQESVEAYAQRTGLPPTKMLDLGDGVKLELVLIPAGRFIMGTPEPVPVDEEGFYKKIIVGQALLALGGGLLLVLLGAVAVQAIRKRQRPKFSLARLLAMTGAAGVAVLSGMHWKQSALKLEQAEAEYQVTKTRCDAARIEEKPAHPVTLTRPFYMGKFEVTQEQYEQVMGRSKCWWVNGKNNPVDWVTWLDAQAFCKKATEQAEQTVRLATEAEWEYSCRAGTKTMYYSGDTERDLDRVAWCKANNKNWGHHPVGQKEPNAFSLYDMHGNVWEWCQDWFAEEYYRKSPAEDPSGPTDGTDRMIRGGCFDIDFGVHRSACRFWEAPNQPPRDILPSSPLPSGFYIGFRIVVPMSKTP